MPTGALKTARYVAGGEDANTNHMCASSRLNPSECRSKGKGVETQRLVARTAGAASDSVSVLFLTTKIPLRTSQKRTDGMLQQEACTGGFQGAL